MKSPFIFIFALLSCANLFAQNIVLNSDLEDENICIEHAAKCSPAGWFFFKPNPVGYLNPIITNKNNSENSNHFFNLMAVSVLDSSREYWQTKLMCPLEMGKNYHLSLKISAQWADPNLNDLGFWFTNQFIYASKDTLLQPDHYVGILDATVKSLKDGWFLIEKNFRAEESGSILVIGNFSRENNGEIIKKRHRPAKPISIYVDDIAITSNNETPCILNQHLKDSLYAIKRRHKLIESITPTIAEMQNSKTPESLLKNPNHLVDTFSINSIQFALDDSRIADRSVVKMLSPLSEKKDQIEKMEVIGYTDDLGTEEHNWELSKNRAASVIKLLVEEIGIDPKIISVRGEGISRKYEQKDLNRRVDIFIYWK